MNTFAHSSPPIFSEVDLAAAIRATLELIGGHLRQISSAEISVDLVGCDIVWGNANQLQQIFTNLLLNAAYALGQMGPGRQGRIAIISQIRAEEVIVEVLDTGPGVPRELRPFIFDAFYASKDRGVGTGLGLSLSRQIAHAHGGRLTLRDDDDDDDQDDRVGATFRLALPRASSSAGRDPRFSSATPADTDIGQRNTEAAEDRPSVQPHKRPHQGRHPGA